MKRKLSPWCKAVKIAMIQKDWSVADLAQAVKMTKEYTSLIHTATVEADRDKLWDNKKVWEALRAKGLQIMNGLDVIEYCLKAGEKDKVLECIDALSGYDSNLEEVAKN